MQPINNTYENRYGVDKMASHCANMGVIGFRPDCINMPFSQPREIPNIIVSPNCIRHSFYSFE